MALVHCALACALAGSLLAVSSVSARAQIEDGPGAGPWERRTPGQLGLDGEALDSAEVRAVTFSFLCNYSRNTGC
eukprot:SAG31_NODE_15461_length_754_cov_0.865649_2_plen_75_part_00